MKPMGVFYATREGQTRRVAEHIAAGLRVHSIEVDVRDLRHPGGEIAVDNYSAALLAASVHQGRHEPEMVKFVKEHRATLQTLPVAFVSVTLSEAGVERPGASPEERAKCAADVEEMVERFFEETNWRPTQVKAVAGALAYSKYNLLMRFIMKRIARKSGAGTDTSRDYEYTDWAALDQFVEQFMGELAAHS